VMYNKTKSSYKNVPVSSVFPLMYLVSDGAIQTIKLEFCNV
jgi:hypothetical protein